MNNRWPLAFTRLVLINKEEKMSYRTAFLVKVETIMALFISQSLNLRSGF